MSSDNVAAKTGDMGEEGSLPFSSSTSLEMRSGESTGWEKLCAYLAPHPFKEPWGPLSGMSLLIT